MALPLPRLSPSRRANPMTASQELASLVTLLLSRLLHTSRLGPRFLVLQLPRSRQLRSVVSKTGSLRGTTQSIVTQPKAPMSTPAAATDQSAPNLTSLRHTTNARHARFLFLPLRSSNARARLALLGPLQRPLLHTTLLRFIRKRSVTATVMPLLFASVYQARPRLLALQRLGSLHQRAGFHHLHQLAGLFHHHLLP
jgi:hypothetical protein